MVKNKKIFTPADFVGAADFFDVQIFETAFLDLSRRADFDFVAPFPSILCYGLNRDDVSKNISPRKL